MTKNRSIIIAIYNIVDSRSNYSFTRDHNYIVKVDSCGSRCRSETNCFCEKYDDISEDQLKHSESINDF
jgi:hypothetical protein